MALYKQPLVAIFEALSSQNNLALVQSEYTIGVPTPYIDPEGVLNTELVITAGVTSPYEGAATVRYTRNDLAALDMLLPQPIRAHDITSVADVIAVLNKQFGLNLQTEDLVAGAVNSLTNDNGDITLTAQANSLGWIGSVTLSFAKGGYDIDTTMTVKNLDGLLYPSRDETKAYAEMYSYWRDFSAQTDKLEPYVVGSSDFTDLAAALTAVTGDAWQTSGAHRYSLAGATVVYNGTTAPRMDANQQYNAVLVVQLSTSNLGYSGKLYCHYGAPDDGV